MILIPEKDQIQDVGCSRCGPVRDVDSMVHIGRHQKEFDERAAEREAAAAAQIDAAVARAKAAEVEAAKAETAKVAEAAKVAKPGAKPEAKPEAKPANGGGDAES